MVYGIMRYGKIEVNTLGLKRTAGIKADHVRVIPLLALALSIVLIRHTRDSPLLSANVGT